MKPMPRDDDEKVYEGPHPVTGLPRRVTVPADAVILEKLATEIGGGGGWYKVEVSSPLKRYGRRVYTIRAECESMAAQRGISLFEEEHGSRHPNQ